MSNPEEPKPILTSPISAQQLRDASDLPSFLSAKWSLFTLFQPYRCPFFECETTLVLDKNNLTKERLKDHFAKHLDRKDHVCSICQQAFHSKRSLSIHMNKHDDQPLWALESPTSVGSSKLPKSPKSPKSPKLPKSPKSPVSPTSQTLSRGGSTPTSPMSPEATLVAAAVTNVESIFRFQKHSPTREDPKRDGGSSDRVTRSDAKREPSLKREAAAGGDEQLVNKRIKSEDAEDPVFFSYKPFLLNFIQEESKKDPETLRDRVHAFIEEKFPAEFHSRLKYYASGNISHRSMAQKSLKEMADHIDNKITNGLDVPTDLEKFEALVHILVKEAKSLENTDRVSKTAAVDMIRSKLGAVRDEKLKEEARREREQQEQKQKEEKPSLDPNTVINLLQTIGEARDEEARKAREEQARKIAELERQLKEQKEKEQKPAGLLQRVAGFFGLS